MNHYLPPPEMMLQRLTFGETYSRALAIGRERWALFLSVGFMIFLPYAGFMVTYMHFIGTLLQAAAADAANQQQGGGANNYNTNAAQPLDSSVLLDTLANAHGEIAKVVAELVLYSFVGIIGGCAIARAVAQLYVGGGNASPVTLGDCIRRAFSRFCNIFCASWIVGLGIMLSYFVTVLVAGLLFAADNALCYLLGITVFCAFVVAFIYIQVAMMLATPVVMVENKGPIQTIQRCWELANNNRCYIYCTLFCMMFCIMFVTGIVMGIVFANNPMARFTTGGAILQTLPYIVVLPLATIVSTVVYLNIRVQHEGLNREVLLRDLGRGTLEGVEYGMVNVEDADYSAALNESKV